MPQNNRVRRIVDYGAFLSVETDAGHILRVSADPNNALRRKIEADYPDLYAAREPAAERPVVTAKPPEALVDLIEPGEAHGDAQTRLFSLYNELTNKIVMGLASDAERRLHTRLHGGLHWISRGAVEVPTT